MRWQDAYKARDNIVTFEHGKKLSKNARDTKYVIINSAVYKLQRCGKRLLALNHVSWKAMTSYVEFSAGSIYNMKYFLQGNSYMASRNHTSQSEELELQ